MTRSFTCNLEYSFWPSLLFRLTFCKTRKKIKYRRIGKSEMEAYSVSFSFYNKYVRSLQNYLYSLFWYFFKFQTFFCFDICLVLWNRLGNENSIHRTQRLKFFFFRKLLTIWHLLSEDLSNQAEVAGRRWHLLVNTSLETFSFSSFFQVFYSHFLFVFIKSILEKYLHCPFSCWKNMYSKPPIFD